MSDAPSRFLGLRSWIFVPANSTKYMEKSRTLASDAIIIDMEDSVPPDGKVGSRPLVAAELGHEHGAATFIRINEMASSWFESDLQTALDGGADGIVLPKVHSVAEVEVASGLIDEWERSAGHPSSLVIVAAIESAVGLVNAYPIASARRVVGLMFGAEDYALDLGLQDAAGGELRDFHYARSTIVVAARAAGGISLDGVYTDYLDKEGLREDTLSARSLGFTGKTLFHPEQIDVINAIFQPTPEDVAYAKEIVEEAAKALSLGKGTLSVRGKLVDLPIVLRAERLLEAHAQRANTSG